jgi:hypothetical protein
VQRVLDLLFCRGIGFVLREQIRLWLDLHFGNAGAIAEPERSSSKATELAGPMLPGGTRIGLKLRPSGQPGAFSPAFADLGRWPDVLTGL